MPYKDKEKQRKAVKEAVGRHRKGITTEGITEQGITSYHPIMYALTDPIKRKKLQDICDSLGRHSVLDRVYYGCGIHSLSMDTVSDLLEATQSH